MNTPEREQIDIEELSSELSVYSSGSLEQLDRKNEIDNKSLKEKAIVWLSIAVIVVILLFAGASIALSSDESTKDWARQTVSTLLGFAAGAMWQHKSRKD